MDVKGKNHHFLYKEAFQYLKNSITNNTLYAIQEEKIGRKDKACQNWNLSNELFFILDYFESYKRRVIRDYEYGKLLPFSTYKEIFNYECIKQNFLCRHKINIDALYDIYYKIEEVDSFEPITYGLNFNGKWGPEDTDIPEYVLLNGVKATIPPKKIVNEINYEDDFKFKFKFKHIGFSSIYNNPPPTPNLGISVIFSHLYRSSYPSGTYTNWFVIYYVNNLKTLTTNLLTNVQLINVQPAPGILIHTYQNASSSGYLAGWNFDLNTVNSYDTIEIYKKGTLITDIEFRINGFLIPLALSYYDNRTDINVSLPKDDNSLMVIGAYDIEPTTNNNGFDAYYLNANLADFEIFKQTGGTLTKFVEYKFNESSGTIAADSAGNGFLSYPATLFYPPTRTVLGGGAWLNTNP